MKIFCMHIKSGSKCVGWIHLGYDGGQMRTLVNSIEYSGSIKYVEFM
jgi:hypothetical protein